MNLTIVTVATESKAYFPFLMDKLKKNNINYKVIGYDVLLVGDKYNILK